jgi:hypothetical protein
MSLFGHVEYKILSTVPTRTGIRSFYTIEIVKMIFSTAQEC